MDTQEGSQLVLTWQGDTVAVGAQAQTQVVLGSAADSQLRLALPFVSRQHVSIELRDRAFVLVDHSTNGTYVQSEDEQITRVHRAEVRLWGEGWLGLGEPPVDANAVHFSLSRVSAAVAP